MQLGIDVSSFIPHVYQQGKYFATFIVFLWASFKAFRWVKDIRDIDMLGLKNDFGTMNSGIVEQTQTISDGFSNLQAATVRELSELRSDFRTFYTSPQPTMIPVRARAARKRASAAERDNADSRTTKMKASMKKPKPSMKKAK